MKHSELISVGKFLRQVTTFLVGVREGAIENGVDVTNEWQVNVAQLEGRNEYAMEIGFGLRKMGDTKSRLWIGIDGYDGAFGDQSAPIWMTVQDNTQQRLWDNLKGNIGGIMYEELWCIGLGWEYKETANIEQIYSDGKQLGKLLANILQIS